MKNHFDQKTEGVRRILIVDDHPIFREGITQIINREPGLTVCGEAADAARAIELVEKLKPDLVLVDITLPGKSGLELIKDLHALRPELPLFILSMHDEALFAERALKAGARAYMMKHEPPRALIEALKQVLGGKIYLNPSTTDRLLMSFAGNTRAKPACSVAALTDREFEVFRLIGRGHDSGIIARELHLSPKTIAVHRSNIKRKLRVASAAELIRLAVCWDSDPETKRPLQSVNSAMN